MPLQAYIDDSGRGHGSVFVLAGFVSTTDRWAAFTDKWKAVLGQPLPEERSRRLSYFKTHEAMTFQEQFEGWNEVERDLCISRLVAVILEHATFRISVSIPMKHYNAEVKGKIARGLDTPYWLAFNWIIIEMLRYQEEHNESEPVDFIFDDQRGRERKEVEKGFTVFRQLCPSSARHLLGRDPIFR